MGALIRTAAATVAAVAVAGTVFATPAAAEPIEPGSVTCEYVVNAVWAGGFMGTINFVNHGPLINGWTIQWSWETPTVLLQSWGSLAVQQGDVVTTTPAIWNVQVGTGASANFGWTGAAPDTKIPTDITINGVPC